MKEDIRPTSPFDMPYSAGFAGGRDKDTDILIFALVRYADAKGVRIEIMSSRNGGFTPDMAVSDLDESCFMGEGTASDWTFEFDSAELDSAMKAILEFAKSRGVSDEDWG